MMTSKTQWRNKKEEFMDGHDAAAAPAATEPYKKLTEKFKVICPPPQPPEPMRFYVGAPAPAAVEAFEDACANVVGGDIVNEDFGKKAPDKSDLDKLKKYVAVPIAFLMKFDPMMVVYNQSVNAALIKLGGNRLTKIITDPSDTTLWKDYETELDPSGGVFGYAASNLEEQQTQDYQKQLDAQKQKTLDDIQTAKDGKIRDPPKYPRPKTYNTTLLKDVETAKTYMAKTVVFALAYLTVYNWAYLLFVYSNTEKPPPKEKNGFTAENAGFMGMGLIGQRIGEFMERYNPFYIAARLMTNINWMIFDQLGKNNMNEYYDKKIWFVLSFVVLIFANQILLVNYGKYMNSIARGKTNILLILINVLNFLLYIYSFYQDFGILSKLELSMGGFSVALMYLFKNIFLIFMIYASQYIVLFFILFFFMFYSLFGMFFYPTFSLDVATRYNSLIETINTDYKEKSAAAADENIFVRGIKQIFYLVYHYPIILIVLWLIFVWVKLIDKMELKYETFRENISISIILLIAGFIAIQAFVSIFTTLMDGGGGARAAEET